MSNKKLERLKSAKKRKKIIHIVIILLCVFTVVGIKINPFDNGKATAVESVAKIEEVYENKINKEDELLKELPEEDNNNIVEVEPEINEGAPEVEIIIPQESLEVKTIIEKYINQENLSEDNFAFFYYNPKNQKYYFYNENKFFTAASTIKVPLAMIYYDKINNGDLTYDSTFQYKSWHYEAGTGRTASEYKARR